MSQRSIHSYFKATPPKRLLSSGDGANEKSPAKRLRNNVESGSKENGSQDVDVKTRIDRQVKLTPALSPNIGHSWFKALELEFGKSYFRGLSAFVQEERRTKTIYPPVEEVFTWASCGDIRDVKVVILGQDPYHGPGQAHGLCFSVKKGVPPPPSLINIFKELESDIKGFKRPGHGDLTGWARQGVLLLNAVMTVRQGTPNSHQAHGWETLTDAVIKCINAKLKNGVFLLWGAFAQKKASLINRDDHLILTAVHPSPLSASKGFFGCKHFSKANIYLKDHGREEIDWKDLY